MTDEEAEQQHNSRMALGKAYVDEIFAELGLRNPFDEAREREKDDDILSADEITDASAR